MFRYFWVSCKLQYWNSHTKMVIICQESVLPYKFTQGLQCRYKDFDYLKNLFIVFEWSFFTWVSLRHTTHCLLNRWMLDHSNCCKNNFNITNTCRIVILKLFEKALLHLMNTQTLVNVQVYPWTTKYWYCTTSSSADNLKKHTLTHSGFYSCLYHTLLEAGDFVIFNFTCYYSFDFPWVALLLTV